MDRRKELIRAYKENPPGRASCRSKTLSTARFISLPIIASTARSTASASNWPAAATPTRPCRTIGRPRSRGFRFRGPGISDAALRKCVAPGHPRGPDRAGETLDGQAQALRRARIQQAAARDLIFRGKKKLSAVRSKTGSLFFEIRSRTGSLSTMNPTIRFCPSSENDQR